TLDRVGKTSFVIWKLEMRSKLWRIIIFAVTQILIAPKRLHHLARIHFPIRVPDLFELRECLHQFVPEHFRKQLSARLTVTMLARKRAAVPDHEIGRLVGELEIFLDPGMIFHSEIDPGVDQPLPEVTVKRAEISEL